MDSDKERQERKVLNIMIVTIYLKQGSVMIRTMICLLSVLLIFLLITLQNNSESILNNLLLFFTMKTTYFILLLLQQGLFKHVFDFARCFYRIYTENRSWSQKDYLK